MKYINYLVLSKFAKGSDNHIDASELYNTIKNHDGSEAYYNHYDVREDALGEDEGKPTFKGASGICRPAFGLVGFDFDDEESPENSLRDVQAFLNYFRFKYFYVAYSGSKGFHISVPFEYFGLDADENLPKTLRNLSHELKPQFKTLDTSVYNIGRKFRAPNTQHPKTKLYKTIISNVGIDTKSMESIKEYCKERRGHLYEPIDDVIVPNETLVHILEKAKTTASFDSSKAGTALAPTRLEEYDGKLCIKRLFEVEIDEGERNTTALILINDIFKSGKHKDYCYQVMKPWVERVMPTHRQDECYQIIEDIYAGVRFYNHGCLEPIKSKHCSAKCGLWSKLAPAKRPTPVDAPKSAFKELQVSNAKPATAFISDWLKENMAVVTLANNWFLNGDTNTPIPRNVIEDRIFNASDLVDRKQYKMVSQNKITAFLNEYESTEKKRRLDGLCTHLNYTGDNDLVEKFLAAVLSREPSNLEVNVLKHWLWLVKRKINSLSTEREMMVVIAGITNTGKTQAVIKLFKPLKELVDTMMLDAIADERHDFRLTENAVVFFDEMAATRKVNVEALKNKITAKWLNYRPLGKTTRVQGKNFATFIGTSNSHVADIIHDPTSARRYFEYWVDAKCQWENINNIDYLEVWRGIDENTTTTYISENIQELDEAQESFRATCHVEDWLSIYELIPNEGEDHSYVKPRQAYGSFMAFMKVQSKERFAYNMKRFFNRMTELGLQGKTGKKGVFYKIKIQETDHFDPSTQGDTSLNF